MTMRRAALALLGALGLQAAAVAPAGAAAAAFAPMDAAVQTARLGRGMNALMGDPLWDGLDKARFKASEFQAIKQAGFSTVRVNLFTFRHLGPDGRLDPTYLRSLDWVVSTGTASGLNLILEVQDMKACAADVAACRPKLLNVWRQIAERYQGAPASVLFEPLNEPNMALNPVWNDMAAEVLAVIRQTNPTRNVVIDSVNWASVDTLALLRLPADDPHLIASFHYYEPRSFTHQGAPFEASTRDLSGVTWETAVDRPRVHADLAKAASWGRAHHRPVLLGEFGAYDAGDMASRARFFDAVAREAEAQGMPWAYWQFDGDFIAWDWKRGGWVEPVLHALVPETR